MLEAQKQQHLRTLRRALNRAVTSFKEDGKVVCNLGWGFGRIFHHQWLDDKGQGESSLPEGDDLFLLLPPEPEQWEDFLSLIPEGARKAVLFFWPGPVHLRVKVEEGEGPERRVRRLTLCSPWSPLCKELLSRSGPVFCFQVSAGENQTLLEGQDIPELDGEQLSVLPWPEPQRMLEPSLLDVSTRPWRFMSQGFVEADELMVRLEEPTLLSEDRAFPVRAIRRYVPEGKTIIVEAEDKSLLPEAVQALRQQVPPDAFVRIYLDESTAHNHFPDDREVRVYGELSDPERVRRRLQAMLERQSRRFGKRVLLIAVAELGSKCDSFRADLEKLSDGWLKVESDQELKLDLV